MYGQRAVDIPTLFSNNSLQCSLLATISTIQFSTKVFAAEPKGSIDSNIL